MGRGTFWVFDLLFVGMIMMIKNLIFNQKKILSLFWIPFWGGPKPRPPLTIITTITLYISSVFPY